MLSCPPDGNEQLRRPGEQAQLFQRRHPEKPGEVTDPLRGRRFSSRLQHSAEHRLQVDFRPGAPGCPVPGFQLPDPLRILLPQLFRACGDTLPFQFPGKVFPERILFFVGVNIHQGSVQVKKEVIVLFFHGPVSFSFISVKRSDKNTKCYRVKQRGKLEFGEFQVIASQCAHWRGNLPDRSTTSYG